MQENKTCFSPIQLGILCVLLMEAQFFYILPLPSIFWFGHNPDNKSYITLILYFLIFCIFVKNNFKIGGSEYFAFVRPYLVFQVIVSAILIARSKYLYSQSWFSMTQCADYLFMPVTAIAFMVAFKGKTNFNRMMKMLFWVIFICQIVIFIQGITYLTTGISFCYGMRESGTIAVRNGMVRSARNALNFIAIGYAMNGLFNNYQTEISRIYIRLMLFVSVTNILFFSGYRTLILGSMSMLFVILFFSKRVGKSVKFLVLCSAVIIFIVVGGKEILQDFFSMEGSYSGSNVTRLGAYDFFWNRFKNSPFFGFGLIRPHTNRTLLLFGGANGYNVTDAAIVGMLSEVGAIGALTYLIIFIRGLYIVKKLRGNSLRPMLVGIMVYIVATAPGLLITNVSRCLAIPVCMAIFESIYYEHKSMLKQNNYTKDGRYI